MKSQASTPNSSNVASATRAASGVTSVSSMSVRSGLRIAPPLKAPIGAFSRIGLGEHREAGRGPARGKRDAHAGVPAGVARRRSSPASAPCPWSPASRRCRRRGARCGRWNSKHRTLYERSINRFILAHAHSSDVDKSLCWETSASGRTIHTIIAVPRTTAQKPRRTCRPNAGSATFSFSHLQNAQTAFASAFVASFRIRKPKSR